MSYEVYVSTHGQVQPSLIIPRSNGMGITIFYPLEVPASGGDTLYLSTTAAYEHLSEDFRRRLTGLQATHSGFSQASVHDHRDRYIREPIETVHPIVRTHPVLPHADKSLDCLLNCHCR